MNSILSPVKRLADRMFFGAVRRFMPLAAHERTRNILVVRTDGIGDMVFFLPMVVELRNRFRNHRFIGVCRTESAPLAELVFDEVIPFSFWAQRRDYWYRLSTLRRVRAVSASLAIYASYHRQHFGDELTLLSGAGETVAFDGNEEIIHPGMRASNDKLFRKIVKVDDHSPEKEKYLRLFEALGRGSDGPIVQRPLKDWISATKEESDLYMVVAPGGSSPLRRWPPSRFATAADSLAEKTGAKIVLLGNREETGLLHQVAQQMKVPVTMKTDLSLKEAATLLADAKVVLSNESGLLHMAASLGVPSVGILGGGHFSRYFPYGSVQVVYHKLDCYECNWKCPYPEPYCITNITVEDVMKTVEEALNSSG